MFRRLIDILCCPLCGEPLRLSVREEALVETESRSLTGCGHYCGFLAQALTSPVIRRAAYSHCPACYQADVTEGVLTCLSDHRFPIRRSIPRFISEQVCLQRTKQTFDVEWKGFHYRERIYGHSQEEELQDFFHRMALDEGFLRDKSVLDAGCGMGRLTQSISRFASEVVGIDFSEGVDDAQRLNRKTSSVHILQGDIMNLPFKEASFDYIFSKGVLHYVSDVRKCLSSLASRVKPGGAMSVTLYPRMSPLFESFNGMLRKATVRLPVRAVFLLSHLLVPLLSLAWRWSGLRRRRIEWNERAHMIFNWLSSPYQNRATNREAEAWFRELGFDGIRFSGTPIGITGIRGSVTQDPLEP